MQKKKLSVVCTSEVAETSTTSTLVTSTSAVVLALGALRGRPVSNATKLVSLGVWGIGDVGELSAESSGAPSTDSVRDLGKNEGRHGLSDG